MNILFFHFQFHRLTFQVKKENSRMSESNYRNGYYFLTKHISFTVAEFFFVFHRRYSVAWSKETGVLCLMVLSAVTFSHFSCFTNIKIKKDEINKFP